jgi:hypothetical protein
MKRNEKGMEVMLMDWIVNRNFAMNELHEAPASIIP